MKFVQQIRKFAKNRQIDSLRQTCDIRANAGIWKDYIDYIRNIMAVSRRMRFL